MRVYLAGPDVFLPDPTRRAATLKAICARHGLTGVSPLDPLPDEPAAWSALPPAHRIALRNEAHISASAAVIANLTPFRGPSADVGTVFEIGFARALGHPVFGWSTTTALFAARSLGLPGTARAADGVWRDAEGLSVEDFGLHDNLMIDSAIIESEGAVVAIDAPEGTRWSDVTAFERCVALAAARLVHP